MRRLALRSLAAHKARLAMTLTAVCLGTAFVAGTLLFTDSTERAADTQTLRNALLGFAAIALLVGTFVIANTFSMLVGQRTRELALLRAVGLSRRQVRRMVLGEAAAVGLLGGVAGIAVGYGFAVLAVRFLDDQGGSATVVVRWPALLASLAVAVGVTVLSAWSSARRAATDPAGGRAARRAHLAAKGHPAAHGRRRDRGRARHRRVRLRRADRPDRRAGRARRAVAVRRCSSWPSSCSPRRCAGCCWGRCRRRWPGSGPPAGWPPATPGATPDGPRPRRRR